ncbi:hypothetical protein [Zavarzinia sp. CC-PAN008]|uniref:hypothetical protein n=1 Tax=Zavarzinia sp. CC-PAN008 TaxID=3243332 RepID=UPI003F748F5C
MLLRFACAAALALVLSAGAMADDNSLPAQPGVHDALSTLLKMPPGRTYTDGEIRAALANSTRGLKWYEHLDEPFRQQILRHPPDRWLAVIICNFQGAPPGTEYAKQCEDAYIQRRERVTSQWDENGNWVGASEACRKANVRTQYGELICQPEQPRPPGS